MQKPTKKPTKRLCPQDFLVDRPKHYRRGRCSMLPMKNRGQGYNWHYRPTHITDRLVRTFSEIHYLTEHAPEKVQKRWNQAKIRWWKRMAWWKSGINNRL